MAGNRPCFFPNRDKNSNFIIDFRLTDFVIQFCENFVKIASKINKLQLIKFRFVVGFAEYF